MALETSPKKFYIQKVIENTSPVNGIQWRHWYIVTNQTRSEFNQL